MKQDLRAETMPKKSPLGDKSVNGDVGGEANSASVSSCERGLSNTPAPRGFNCSIDYLKIRFDQRFDVLDAGFEELFRLLRLDIYNFIDKGHRGNFELCYIYDESVEVFSGGKNVKNAAGEDVTILEMKGQACRLFEERVVQESGFFDNIGMAQVAFLGAWRQLFLCIAKMQGKCLRIDLPVDDLSGNLPFEELHEKILNKEYSTNLRSFKLNDDFPQNVASDTVREGKYKSFSATYGGTDKTQLCIYNKLAERLAHGGTLNTSFWIRYEVRYFHKVADKAMESLIDFLEAGKFFEFCMRCLKGVITFRDLGNWDPADVRHAPVWPKWEKFLKDVGALSFGSRDLNKSTLQKQGQWLLRSAAKAIARISFVFKDNADDVLKYLAYEGAKHLEVSDIAVIDNYLKCQRRKPIGYLNGIVDGVNNYVGDPNALTAEVKNFFGGFEEQERDPSISLENFDGESDFPLDS